MKGKLSKLGSDELQMLTYFVDVMIKLIDRPYQTIKVRKYALKTIKTAGMNAVVAKHLNWISVFLQETEVSTLSMMDSYFNYFPFNPTIEPHKKILTSDQE